MSPRMKTFNAGSIIYFEGDRGDQIYLLKEGKISLIYKDIITGEELVDQISSGEFFGVKSGITHRPREETARVITNSIIYEFTPQEFESLIIKNPNIIIRMLRTFSNQLKNVHKQIQKIVGEKTSGETCENFFKIGDYYFKNKKYSQAITVYKRYLNYYPNDYLSNYARKRLKQAQEALQTYGDDGGPTPILEEITEISKKSTVESANNEIEKFDNLKDAVSNEIDQKSQYEIETDDESTSKESKLYYKALSYMSQGKYMDAFHTLKIVLSNGDEKEKRLANVEIGKCLYNLKKYPECIKHYTSFLANNQNLPEKNEILFYLASSYQAIGEKDKAEKIFNTIVSSGDESDPIFRKAQKALKELN